jgi:hypothetical protein
MFTTMTNGESVADQFQWGPLGETWWREAAKTVGSTERQLRFACSIHQGASNTAAARAAPYTGNADAIRQVAYRAARTNAVQNLLALAAAEAKGGNNGTVDGAEMRRILSGMARGNDPSMRIRAIESLQKLEERGAELGRVPDDDGFAEWRTVRDFLRLGNGSAVIVLLWDGIDQSLANLPLLHDVVRTCDPEIWARIYGRQSPTTRAVIDAHLADPDWQRAARVKIWKEVGTDVLALPAGAASQHAAVRSAIDARFVNGAESANARG